ncbi:hypothetical protein J437_LFUL012174 [Ladona fulva]|uniref:Uncharacterized protein n=1 Tax=Ladona fulva TaxID=123851 RepID=A0A8K0P3X1_LADFU|nr:hypothetical protein J437_LFUL012174 [Ladona fulva]
MSTKVSHCIANHIPILHKPPLRPQFTQSKITFPLHRAATPETRAGSFVNELRSTNYLREKVKEFEKHSDIFRFTENEAWTYRAVKPGLLGKKKTSGTPKDSAKRKCEWKDSEED